MTYQGNLLGFVTPPESVTFRFLHQPTNPMSVGPLANNASNGGEEDVTHLLRMHQWIFASPDFRGVP